jgi:hypothetical protein
MPDRAGAAEAAELRFVIHNELDIIMADDDDVCGGQNQSAKCLRHYIEDVYNRDAANLDIASLDTVFLKLNKRKGKKKKKGTSRAIGGAGPAFL